MNQYEAMFVFDPTFGGAFENCETEIRRLIDRAGAEVVFLRRWDERRLAYRIKGRKRGVYVLVYFKADPSKIAAFERDAQLSEHILRLLVLRAEGVTQEMMEKAMPSRAALPEEDGGAGKEAKATVTQESEKTDKAPPDSPAADEPPVASEAAVSDVAAAGGSPAESS